MLLQIWGAWYRVWQAYWLASTEEYIDGQCTGNLGEVLIRFATQNKAFGACQTGKREVEACQKHANDKVNSAVSDTSSIPQKGSTNIAEAKKKYFRSGEKISPMFSGEKRSHANTVTELGKKSASHDKKYHDS